jgi:hypothetical protein
MRDDTHNASRRRNLTVATASNASALFATQKISAEELGSLEADEARTDMFTQRAKDDG